MFKKLILVGGFIFLFLGVKFVYASDIIINEFVSNSLVSGDDEWVELLNTGEVDIFLDGWMIKDGNSDTKDDISLSGILSANGILVFNHKDGWLNDGGDLISLYDGLNLIDQVVYGVGKDLTAPTAGKSGALISGVWETNQEPTKGTQNSSSSSTPPPSDNSGSSSSSSDPTTTPEPKPKVIQNPTMKVKILANTLTFTGQILEIKANVFGYSNENVVLGRVSWNFGDGGSFEQINNFEKFSHIYYYPGEYILFLEYYSNSFSKDPEAVSKMVIKVLSTSVSISKVGDAKDFFIELSNNASSDIDISSWVINTNGKTFILPKNSIIMSKKQMIISGKITGFTFGDQNNLKLYSGTGELVYDYSSSKTIQKISPLLIKERTQTAIPTNNLLASAVSSDTINSDSANNSHIPIIPIAFFAFIGASAGAVYFIRQKKVISKDGDDFEILDE